MKQPDEKQIFPSAKGGTKRVVIDVGVIAKARKEVKTGQRLEIADTVCGGLRLRVGRRDSVWRLLYRQRGVDENGKRFGQRAITLGTAVTLSPADARAKAGEIKNAVAEGRDPLADKQQADRNAARERALRRSLGDWLTDYAAEKLPNTQHGHTEASQVRLGLDEMVLTNDEPAKLTAVALEILLSKHRERPATARLRFGAVSRFAGWLVRRNALTVNPSTMFGKKERPKPPSARKMVLDAEGVQAVWTAAPELGEIKSTYLRAALLLPLRAGELAELRPRNIDLKRGAVVLSHRETKNGDDFALPLVGKARDILAERVDQVGYEERLFQLNGAGGAMNAWTPFMKRVRGVSGIVDFRLHDIRKLFVSTLAEHKIGDADIADSLLNHRQSESRGGIKGVYQQSTRWGEKQRLMAEWGRLVTHAVEHGDWPDSSAQLISFTGARA